MKVSLTMQKFMYQFTHSLKYFNEVITIMYLLINRKREYFFYVLFQKHNLVTTCFSTLYKDSYQILFFPERSAFFYPSIISYKSTMTQRSNFHKYLIIR